MRVFKYNNGFGKLIFSDLSAQELFTLYKFTSQEMEFRINSPNSYIHELLKYDAKKEDNPLLRITTDLEQTYYKLLESQYGPAREPRTKAEMELLLEGAIEKSHTEVTTEAAPATEVKKKTTKKKIV